MKQLLDPNDDFVNGFPDLKDAINKQLSEIYENILDESAESGKERLLVIKVGFKPKGDKRRSEVERIVKPTVATLAGRKPTGDAIIVKSTLAGISAKPVSISTEEDDVLSAANEMISHDSSQETN